MKVLKPQAFDLATQLLGSSAGETVAEYASGTTYALNDSARYGDRIYRSAQAGNTGHQPDASPTWWVDAAPSNATAMFDQQTSTVTTATGDWGVLISAPLASAVAVLGISGLARIDVVGTRGVGGTEVYNESYTLVETVPISDWYEYFFEPLADARSDLLITDVPVYNDLVLSITFVLGGASGSVGTLAIGRVMDLGITLASPKAGIIDYSRKETDAYGTTLFVQRDYAKRLTLSVVMDNSRLNGLFAALAALRATPCVWIGSDDAELAGTLIVYGFYRDFTIDIAYPEQSLCSLEIEGLT